MVDQETPNLLMGVRFPLDLQNMVKHIQTSGDQLKDKGTKDQVLQHLVGLDQDKKTKPDEGRESKMNKPDFLDQNGDGKTQPGKETR